MPKCYKTIHVLSLSLMTACKGAIAVERIECDDSNHCWLLPAKQRSVNLGADIRAERYSHQTTKQAKSETQLKTQDIVVWTAGMGSESTVESEIRLASGAACKHPNFNLFSPAFTLNCYHMCFHLPSP